MPAFFGKARDIAKGIPADITRFYDRQKLSFLEILQHRLCYEAAVLFLFVSYQSS